jgi:hypothetical protein
VGGIVIAGKPVEFTFEKRAWSKHAQRALSPALYGRDEICAAAVRSGRRELFLVNGDSWLVTEIVYGNKLFIWAYAGKRLVQLIGKLRIVAAANNLRYIGFFTLHQAALRGCRRYRPIHSPTAKEGECEYLIDCQDVVVIRRAA